MQRTMSLLFSFIMVFILAACAQYTASEKQKEMQSAVQKAEGEMKTSRKEAAAEKPGIEGEPDADVEAEMSVPDSDEEAEADVSTKILVVYFSCTETTKHIAEYVTEILEADIYRIEPENPYTEADLAYYTNGRADQEQKDPGARPAISGGVENMDKYDTIILDYPIWLAYHNLIQCTQA